MASFLRSPGALRLVAAAGLASGITLTPGVAQAGFFDQLFGGGGPAAPAQPSYDYQAPEPGAPDFGAPIARPHKKKVVLRDAPPVRQKTTDLMSDKTLHAGDAIMMKDGLHIYSGPEAAKHTAKQFVPIDHAKYVSSKMRASLVAMDTTRNDPLKKGLNPDTIASGRSAAVSAPISKGFKITDARGLSVRYVGP